MTLGDILTETRALLAETDSSGFFTDQTLTIYTNNAQMKLALALKWPALTLQTSTVNGTQEYTLPEDALRVDAIYVAGQPLIPVTIPMLEGWGLELWDDTGTNYKPEWQVLDQAPYASPTGYPVTTGFQGTIIDTVPGAPLKPAWYPRGGNIGLIPVPNGVFTITVLGIAKPPDLANNGDTSIYPEITKLALCYKVCELARKSERHYDEAAGFKQDYNDELPDLIDWKENLYPQQNRPQYRSYRSGYPRMMRR